MASGGAAGGGGFAPQEHREVESVGGDLTLEMWTDLGFSIAESPLVENDEERYLLKRPPTPKIYSILKPVRQLFSKSRASALNTK